MPIGADMPSIRQIVEIAESFGYDIDEQAAASYRNLMRGAMNSYRRLEQLPELRLPVKYPRTPGHRPPPEDNPHNGWYVRCRIDGAQSGPLKGYDVAVKDAICVAGMPMMNGSRVLEGYIPDVDATVVTRILDAGGTVVGKTTTEDCSFSGGGHTAALGPVENPRKPTHAPGASSNGSAVVIATGQVKMALGGDQGGSIRIPAAWSGVVGHKPTYGLVPYTGCMMIEMTLDHCGPMADTVENCARLLSVIAGPDPLDPRQRGVFPPSYANDYAQAIGKGVQGLRIGLVKEGFGIKQESVGLPPSEAIVDEKVKAAARKLAGKGAIVEEVSVPGHYDAWHIFNAIILEGATQFMMKGYNLGTNWQGFYNTGMLDAVAKGSKARGNDYPPTVKLVSILGEYMYRQYNGRYYAKAQNLRHLARKAYDDALAVYDALVMPTIPFRATPLPPADCSIEDYFFYALNMTQNAAPFDVTGHPAISVPCGMADGLPIGLMVVGKHFDDLACLQVADAVEKLADWMTM
jgi:amidase